MNSRKRITVALVGLIALVVLGWFVGGVGLDDSSPPGSDQVPGAAESGFEVRPLSALPPEAAQTWHLVESGGPFPHPGKDGSVFGNREGLLPDQSRGYYQEYTVPTPGSSDRGARRLITGRAHEVYYTADHYESFVVVDPHK